MARTLWLPDLGLVRRQLEAEAQSEACQLWHVRLGLMILPSQGGLPDTRASRGSLYRSDGHQAESWVSVE